MRADGSGPGREPRLALPKGRFLSRSRRVLRDLAVEPDRHERRYKWRAPWAGVGVSVWLLKVQDIPLFLAFGAIDVGVCCDEWMAEHRVALPELVDLRWCKSRVVLAALADTPLARLRRVASPYPNIARRVVGPRSADCEILSVSGAAEAMVPGLCDGVVDCVETGRTLAANDLATRREVLRSSVRAYVRPEVMKEPWLPRLRELLEAHAVPEERGAAPESAIELGSERA